jgi:hypothetical protein
MPTTTTTDFNITIQLGKDKKNVTLQAPDLDKAGTDGLHFALPPDTAITLGTLAEFIDWFNAQKLVNVTIPDAADSSWPDVIKTIFNGVLNAEVTITQFTFDQDPKSGTTSPDPTFSLAVTATAQDSSTPPKPKPVSVAGFFSIVGGGIGITRTNSAT